MFLQQYKLDETKNMRYIRQWGFTSNGQWNPLHSKVNIFTDLQYCIIKIEYPQELF